VAMLAFFRDKILAAARPAGQDGGLGVNTTIRASIDAAEPQIDKTFAGQPIIEASIRETLGTTYRDLGEPARAIRQHERAVALFRKAQGPDHRDSLMATNNLAMDYQDAGRLADAIALFEETLKRLKAKLGPDDPATLATLSNLASAYREVGRLAEAINLDEETLRRRQTKLGPDHPQTLRARMNLARAYEDAGRLAEAVAIAQETIERQIAALGPDHPDTLQSLQGLARLYLDMRQLPRALAIAEDTFRKQEARLGPDHPNSLATKTLLARIYLADQPARAEAILQDVLRAGPKNKPDDWRTLEALGLLGTSRLRQKKYPEAEAVLLQAYEKMKLREAQVPAEARNDLAEVVEQLVQPYNALGQKEKAEAWRKKREVSKKP
jgi:eukaryotic-like serine/threonine-protein kinase